MVWGLMGTRVPNTTVKRSSSVTIRDLAAQLGLSHPTVSRALAPGQGRSHVSPETRERVARLARKLGYQPNALARHLVSRRTDTVGVIVRHFNDPFFSNLIQEIHDNLTRRHYLAIFYSARDTAELEQAIDSLLSRRVDGLVSIHPACPEEAALIRRVRIPVVCYAGASSDTNSVHTDQYEGAVLAMEHLRDLGHTAIGFIGRTDVPNSRFEGYRHVLAAASLPTVHDWIGRLDGTAIDLSVGGMFRNGYEQMRRFLALAKRPTAVLCHNDVLAIGAQRAVLENGLRIPDDMALVGFDNLQEGEYAAVPLTTVDSHMKQLAQGFTDILIRNMERPGRSRRPVHVRLAPALIVRRSTVGCRSRVPAVKPDPSATKRKHPQGKVD